MPFSPASLLLTLQRLKAVPQAKLASVADDFRTAEELLSGLTQRETLFDTSDLDDELRRSSLDLERWSEMVFAPSQYSTTSTRQTCKQCTTARRCCTSGECLRKKTQTALLSWARAPRAMKDYAAPAKFAAQLADAGYVVVSGLAAGIDTAAHRGALAKGRRTVAVIGTGHSHSFPPANAALQEQLASEHAVVSQFVPDQARRGGPFLFATQ